MSETIYDEVIEEVVVETNDEIIEDEMIEYIEPEPIVVVDLRKEQHEIEEDGVVYIVESTYRVFSDGSEVLACSAKYPKPSEEPVAPEPTQLDRIEAAVNNIAENSTSYAEMAAAITEGVNDV